MTEIIFKDKKVQTGERVKIPQPIIDTMNIKKGDRLVIKFDPDKKSMKVEIKK